MTSVIISSDADSVCQTIGKEVASVLGIELLDASLLEEVAARYKVKEDKLRRVLDAASSSRMSTKSRDLLLAYIQTVTLERMVENSVVCIDLAAHLYVRAVSHVLMVHVLSDAAAQVNKIAARTKVSPRKAQKLQEREKARRARWSLEGFGIDENSPSIYDMVISLGQIEQEKVVEIIKDMAGYRKFQPMTYSRRCLEDLATASKVRAALLSKFPDIKVGADGDTAIVHIKCSKRQKQKAAGEIKEIAGKIPEVSLVEVHAVQSLRDLKEAGVTG
jgi:cytidylate kinase